MIRFFRRYSTKEKVENAFSERLKQLEEEVVQPNDTLLGHKYKSLIDKDERLVELSHKLEQKKFEHQHQQMIYSSKIPIYAGKQEKEIAFSKPWTGQESLKDSSLRMLIDKNKPLKFSHNAKKLLHVRETVLDFKINKNHVDEDSSFRNIYKEKFTPIGSFDKIKTLADARIEEAMRQGSFQNIPRGKKLDTEVKPYVDRTEHHLNNILIKQNIVPPWIEKQGGVNSEIAGFRKNLIRTWENHIQHSYNKDHSMMKVAYKKKWKTEYEHNLKLVNNSIRTYNLQAPLSTQKFYLIMDEEWERCFNTVDVDSVRELERLRVAAKEDNIPATEPSGWKFWKWKNS